MGFATIPAIWRVGETCTRERSKLHIKRFMNFRRSNARMEREAKLHYGDIKQNIARRGSLGIGFGELGWNQNDWEDGRVIMRNGREKENKKI